MPAPSMPTLVTFWGGTPSGRLPPRLMRFMAKKKVEIMFLATGVMASQVRPRDSIFSAVSKSSRAASTAQSRMTSGAGIRPRVFFRSMAGAMVMSCATCGLEALPPGSRKPLRSQGWTAASALPCCALIQAFAAGTSASCDSTSSCTMPASRAAPGSSRVPSSR